VIIPAQSRVRLRRESKVCAALGESIEEYVEKDQIIMKPGKRTQARSGSGFEAVCEMPVSLLSRHVRLTRGADVRPLKEPLGIFSEIIDAPLWVNGTSFFPEGNENAICREQ
jgi:hypothetical protein